MAILSLFNLVPARMAQDDQPLVAAPAPAPAPATASAPPPAPPTTNEPDPEAPYPLSHPGGRRFHGGDPPAAWPKIAAARGLTPNSANIKRTLGLHATAKPLPKPAYKVRKAAGKGKAAESLAAKRAVVGAGDDTDRSEGDSRIPGTSFLFTSSN
ncbi:hypothetical protein DL769_002709 [Monosporascus sp. CRB-8-3]|nr:hypothetical protein DL769_002709 [Monosporascus sp. CRB-8-3]